MAAVVAASSLTRVGYACAWWHPREQTWSYTATRLRSALDGFADVVDLEAQRSVAGKALLRGLCAPVRGVPWQYSAVERALRDRAVRRGVRALRPDAVLAIGEVDTPTSVPTFLYQDLNFAADIAIEERSGVPTRNLLPSSDALRRRRASDQLERARAATGVFAMSRWYRDFLVEHGVAHERVAVAPAGMNNPPTAHRDPARPPAGRLLFVGAYFERKGGDLVVEAVRRLNAAGDRAMTLTIAGPPRWPLRGDAPKFVDFRGRLGPKDTAALYAEHDLFVMPSRAEAYGIVLAEALTAGLPCVARRAFAMPEIVEDGVTGTLVESEDPDELAAAIDALLADDDVYSRVAQQRGALLARHSWSAVAEQMVARIENRLEP